jgi:FAD:protein FMN transferase
MTENTSKLANNRLLQRIAHIILIFIIAAGFFRVYYHNKTKPRTYKTTGFYLDTYVEITIAAHAELIRNGTAKKAVAEAMEVFEEIDNKFNFHQEESLLNTINSKTSVEINDPVLIDVLTFSLEAAQKTDGMFDPTLGSIKLVYPIGQKNPYPPSSELIEKALVNSGYEKVSFSENILTKPEGLMIDLGGILKGYTIERAANKLKQAGFENFIINAGGDIRSSGMNLEEEPWKVGVENPRKHGDIITILQLDNQAVATSGDYQRYFLHEGTRYHHIFDPRNGKPASKAILATVIASDVMTADVYSTAVFVMGKEDGLKFLENNGLEGIIIDENGAGVTKGLKSKIRVNY